MEAKVSIVIPIYNNISSTLKCLESLKGVDYKDYEVVIVDDGSTDGSSEMIRGKYPDTIIVPGDGDLWWSGGVNEGIKYALNNNAEFILLLNNDNIVSPDFIDKLLQTYYTNAGSIICSKVYLLNDKRILFAGGYTDSFRGGLNIHGFYKEDAPEYNIQREVEWCGGMGVLINKNIIASVGLFDNVNFPQYYGDADYFFRARQKGVKVIYCPQSIVWNDKESSGINVKANKLSMKYLKSILFSNKSNNNLRTNIMFYKKYFNTIVFASIIFTRYSRILLSLLKHQLKNAISTKAGKSGQC